MNKFYIKLWSLLILLFGMLKIPVIQAENLNVFPMHTSEKLFLDVIATSEAFAFNANGMEVDVVANDRINATDNVILTAVNSVQKNSTIETVGAWPTGIYLSNTGKLVLVAGTIMPRVPLQYKLTNIITQNSATASIILYDVSNKFSNGEFYIWNEVDKSCYDTNANESLFTLHIVNIGATSTAISSAAGNGNKFRINATNVDNLNNNNDSNWSDVFGYPYYKFLTNATAIPSFGEITFKYRKSSITGNDTEVKLNAIRFGSMNGSEVLQSLGSVLDSYNAIKIYKAPTTPNLSTKTAFLGHNLTVQSVSGVSDSDVSKYKYYKLDSGIYTEILPNTPFNNTTLGNHTYYYSAINSAGCLGDKVALEVNVFSTSVTGGSVNINNTTGNVVTTICPEGSVQINNQVHGDTALLSKIYSWEVSENNGVNWNSLNDDSTGADYNYNSDFQGALLHLRAGITLSNIKKSIWLRRKTTEVNILTTNPYAYSNPIKINVENVNINFPNGVKTFSAALNTSFVLPVATSSVSGSTITYYTNTGAAISTISVPVTQKGSFLYTVKAVSPLGCVAIDQFEVNVFDINDCTTRTKKTYAKKAMTWTSGASKTFFQDEAISNNNAAYATLSGGVVLLGIGTVGIDLYFVKANGTLYTPAELVGKKVTIKLGEQYSGLKVAGGLSAVARITNETDPANLTLLNSSNTGKTFGVKGGVLDLLKGDNVFMFSFTPKGFSGENIPFNGIRLQLGSLLGVADLATVFYAYIEDDLQAISGSCVPDVKTVTPNLYHIDNNTKSLLYPNSQTDIDGNVSNVQNNNIILNNFAEDVTWGNRTEVLSVASALSSIVHPYYAADNDYNSYALINSTVGVLNQQFLQVHLKQKAQPGDQVRVVLSYPNINLINLSLLQLGNFKLVYYLGNTEVGFDTLEQFRILDIGLFNFGNHKKAVLVKPIKVPFDRIEIRQFQTINVNIGAGLHIYDIRVQPQMLFEGQTDPKQVTTICAAEPIAVQKPDICTTYKLSFAKILTWGNQLTDENGALLFEADGITPIRSILAIQDIPNSNLTFKYQSTNTNGTFTDHFNIARLYKEDENDKIVLLKIQSVRQGCDYGEPEYLKVKLQNCKDAVSNPNLRILSR